MYSIKRSDRRTLGLYALKNGEFEVRAPYFVTDEEIAEFVRKNGSITEQWRLNAEEKAKSVLNYGSSIPFRGKLVKLVSRNGNNCGYDGDCFYAPPGLTSNELIRVISDLLKKLAKQSIIPLAEKIATEVTLSTVNRFTITSARSRWGSCSGNGNISFSWRLTCADKECIEYVIIHELCHLKYANHSRQFWQEVEKYMPDWQKKRLRLRETQKTLDALGLF